MTNICPFCDEPVDWAQSLVTQEVEGWENGYGERVVSPTGELAHRRCVEAAELIESAFEGDA